MKRGIERDYIGYLFVLPNVLIYGVFVFVPLMFTVFYSLTNFNLFSFKMVGFSNYVSMFSDKHFITSIQNTMVYTASTIFISMALGLAVAMALHAGTPGRGFFRPLLYLPNIVSVAAASMAWLYLYNRNMGVFNFILESMGLEGRSWLTDIDTALPSIILMGIWSSVGYNMIVYTSGLNAIPAYLYEAASIDGASGFRKFLHITFPMLSPTTFFLFVMQMISSFQVFGQVYNMTNGGPMNRTTTIAHQIYINGFEGYKMGYASAQAVFLLVITSIMTLLSFRYGDQSRDLEAA